MKSIEPPRRATISILGMDGAMLTLAPLPLVFPFAVPVDPSSYLWRVPCALFAAVACIACAVTLYRRPVAAKFYGVTAFICCFPAALPYIASNPFAALTVAVMTIAGIFGLAELKARTVFIRKRHRMELWLQRARWAATAAPLAVVSAAIIDTTAPRLVGYVMTISSVIVQLLFANWVLRQKSKWRILLPAAGIPGVVALNVLSRTGEIPAPAFLISCIGLLLLPHSEEMTLKREPWWGVLLNHPARILFTAFLSLCMFGTMLLTLPFATQAGALHLIDAAFTSVSAVCITGLTVLDTSADFTRFGQLFILTLIQLGGLGIMTITTVGLHTMGHRFSLQHERLLTSITDTDHKTLLHSLATILKFTFIAEGTGALLLTVLFRTTGDTLMQAAWRGVFTAISAFCNAGFALQTDNLISYATHPLILHVIAVLIISGGLAPATCMLIPRRLIGKTVPVSARIALVTTAVLLFSGTFLFLAFEWEGVLTGLSFGNKLHNAWFQSVTLRTAGFNSLPVAAITSPTLLFMLCFMFIGGSPGGTAGGIKTTTIGVLAMTFWANTTSRNDVLLHNRRVPPGTVYRAITIAVSGLIVWSVTVLMLDVTQGIPVRGIVFEATSALGTVGLSTGATALLDEIGKIIIMIAMFAGRIGPMTLFMLLGDDRIQKVTKCPDAKISLT
ncbi:MAG: hypothetical protein JW913_03130 [Chitinispirillaceae bacterium]|nr:hypothetical protein [Chitinispirillaceae bacterium]